VNNVVARVAGLIAVAVLPALAGITQAGYLHAGELAPAFRTASLLTAACCAAGGVLAAVAIRNPERPARPAAEAAPERLHCALDGPPIAAER